MVHTRKTRLLLLLRDGLIILTISIVLFTILEVAVRSLWPQNVKSTSLLPRKTLGVADTELGHLHGSNSHTRQEGPEFTVEYKINNQGLRDNAIHAIPKPSGSTRILLLGDSFTFGTGNHYEEIWPVIFERALLDHGYDVDVVKAGVSGFDTRTEILYLERLLPKYHPDIVVLAFLPNDLFTNTAVNENDLSRSDKLPPGRAVVAPEKRRGHARDRRSQFQSVTLAKRILISNDLLYAAIYMMTARAEYFSVPPSELLLDRLNITKDLLARGLDDARTKGVELCVLSIPQQFQVLMKANRYERENIDVDFIDVVLAEFASEKGFTWIPTLEMLAATYESNRNDLYFRVDGHLNGTGNNVVGEYFAAKFIEELEGQLEPASTVVPENEPE